MDRRKQMWGSETHKLFRNMKPCSKDYTLEVRGDLFHGNSIDEVMGRYRHFNLKSYVTEKSLENSKRVLESI